MKRLWHDIQTQKRAAALFLLYWLATLAVTAVTWDRGIPPPVVVLHFATPPIAGTLVGLWRASTPERAACSGGRIGGGMLAGALSGGIDQQALGVLQGVIEGIHRGSLKLEQPDEVLGFLIFFLVAGSLLGLAGAVLAIILDRFRRHRQPAPSV